MTLSLCREPRTSPLAIKAIESPFKPGVRVVLHPANNTELDVIHE
mgnify:CR=1 FL=1